MTELDKYLGKQANDLPAEVVENLISKGYTISPHSGRVRKRIHKKKKFYQRSRFKKAGRAAIIILLILLFLASLVIIMPQMSQEPKPKRGTQRGR